MIKAKAPNKMAIIIVALLSISSMPFFLPKKVSAPPAMEPDKPALFPDCNKIYILSHEGRIIQFEATFSPPLLLHTEHIIAWATKDDNWPVRFPKKLHVSRTTNMPINE